MFSASFRHGITTETSGAPGSSASGASGATLVGANVLMDGRLCGYNARKSGKWRPLERTGEIRC